MALVVEQCWTWAESLQNNTACQLLRSQNILHVKDKKTRGASSVKTLDPAEVWGGAGAAQVRTQTLVKNAIIQVDATPFKQFYQQHYGTEVGLKKKSAAATAHAAEAKAAEAKPAEGDAEAEVSALPLLYPHSRYRTFAFFSDNVKMQ